MAAQGLRATDDGVEKIADPTERARVWRRARSVIVGATVTTLVSTVLLALVPSH